MDSPGTPESSMLNYLETTFNVEIRLIKLSLIMKIGNKSLEHFCENYTSFKNEN